MKLINADKYKKDIEHYRNTICYQRNVTMDDCMRILDKQEDVINTIRAELHATAEYHIDGGYYIRDEWIDEIFDKYKAESEVEE